MENKEYCQQSFRVYENVKSISIRDLIPGIKYYFDGDNLHVDGYIDTNKLDESIIWENPTGKYICINYRTGCQKNGTTVFAKINIKTMSE